MKQSCWDCQNIRKAYAGYINSDRKETVLICPITGSVRSKEDGKTCPFYARREQQNDKFQ